MKVRCMNDKKKKLAYRHHVMHPYQEKKFKKTKKDRPTFKYRGCLIKPILGEVNEMYERQFPDAKKRVFDSLKELWPGPAIKSEKEKKKSMLRKLSRCYFG